MISIMTVILNMSITASYAALGVIGLRLLLRRAPRGFSYALWLAVLVRLAVPVSFSSPFGFLQFLQPDAQTTGVMKYVPSPIHKPLTSTDGLAASFPPASPEGSIDPIQLWLTVMGYIWAAGAIVLLVHAVISYLRIGHKLKTATLLRDNIYETDRIAAPFVYGLIKPRIVIPVGLSEDERMHVLAHEQRHIRRLDHLIKPLGYAALIVHWFNPLIWLSYALMNKDMEMSCDEHVIKKLSREAKAGYSRTLLALSVKRQGWMPRGPLAFGESHVATRIKHILRYKKPNAGVLALCCMAVFLFITGFSVDPAAEKGVPPQEIGKLAADWANALKTRDGEPRYNMMSNAMKDRFRQEQIARSGENWNFNIGSSSPWVIDYAIVQNGQTARITYFEATSEPAAYQSEEILTFGTENGRAVIVDYQMVYEDKKS